MIWCLGGLLLAGAAGGLYVHRRDGKRISELESRLGVLKKQEEQSMVDRRVSEQMERIANGQQVLAEERSREAIEQADLTLDIKNFFMKSSLILRARFLLKTLKTSRRIL